MPAPAALTGKRRSEALRLIASGSSDREVGRKFGVDHKVISRMRKSTEHAQRRDRRSEPIETEPTTTAPTATTSITLNDSSEQTQESILEDDLRLRLVLRNGLAKDFDTADDPRARATIARELGSVLDGIRKTLAVDRPDTGDEDVEAAQFDAYMLRLVQKGRVIVNADSGLPIEEESTGEVGDRARANGTDG